MAEPYLPGESPAAYLVRTGYSFDAAVSPLFGKPMRDLDGEERRAEVCRMTGGTEAEIAAAVAKAKAAKETP